MNIEVAVCANGHPEGRIAALAYGDPSTDADWGIAESCSHCARLYVEHSWAARAVRTTLGRSASTDLSVGTSREARQPHSALGPALRTWLPPRRLAAAVLGAALLLGTGLAVAALLRRTVFLGSNPGGQGRVAQFATRVGLDFDAAGIGGESRVLAWLSFVLPDGGMGTGALVQRGDARRLDFAAFDDAGRPVWVASRAWHDWATTLGENEVELVASKVVTLRRTRQGDDDAICLVLRRRDRSALVLVEPSSGKRVAITYLRGTLSPERSNDESVAVVPAADGQSRNILLTGQSRRDATVYPSCFIVASDGTIIQHLSLPTLGIAGSDGASTIEARVDWTPDRPEAVLATSEELLVSLLFRSGRLDVPSALVMIPDHLPPRYDERRGAGAFERTINEAGGEEVYVKRLASMVREEPIETLRGWKGR